ncbi:MAG TPA: type IV toxin-antitoxin system AbiEi family antitoxin domain-containing protein [Kribbella sp.]
MNKRLSKVVDDRGGWFTRADATESGYSDSEIRLRLRRGRWSRLCRDAYVEPGLWPAGELPWERTRRLHLLLTRAVVHRMGDGAAVSHQSAAVLYGLPSWGLDLDRVHLTKPTGRARSDRTTKVHRSPLEPDDVGQVLGVCVTSAARAIVETTCGSSYEVGVVLSDGALREGRVTTEQLTAMAKRFQYLPGSPAARAAVGFADGLSESVGESRLRVLMENEGLPTPRLQVEIRDSAGNLLGRVDFLLERRLIVEFDGAQKYDSAEVVVAEKRREDRLRELGYAFVRVSWSDLNRPRETGDRLRRSLARSIAA